MSVMTHTYHHMIQRFLNQFKEKRIFYFNYGRFENLKIIIPEDVGKIRAFFVLFIFLQPATIKQRYQGSHVRSIFSIGFYFLLILLHRSMIDHGY